MTPDLIEFFEKFKSGKSFNQQIVEHLQSATPTQVEMFFESFRKGVEYISTRYIDLTKNYSASALKLQISFTDEDKGYPASLGYDSPNNKTIWINTRFMKEMCLHIEDMNAYTPHDYNTKTSPFCLTVCQAIEALAVEEAFHAYDVQCGLIGADDETLTILQKSREEYRLSEPEARAEHLGVRPYLLETYGLSVENLGNSVGYSL
jgi:hypothetical protein